MWIKLKGTEEYKCIFMKCIFFFSFGHIYILCRNGILNQVVDLFFSFLKALFFWKPLVIRMFYMTDFNRFDYAVLCWITQSCLTLCNPKECSQPGSCIHGNSPGKHTGVGCPALPQGIFPTQGSNPGFLHCRQILYCLSHQGSPTMMYL